jgi:pantoate--beta-alanine ligase
VLFFLKVAKVTKKNREYQLFAFILPQICFKMTVFKTIKDLQFYLAPFINDGLNIGFVPTMGALHQGHLSLIDESKNQNQITICSIFVNPTQFNDPKDFEKYPITIEADKSLLNDRNCDILFLPSVNEMYPNGTSLTRNYDLGFIETVFDGSHRPGHFQGVCQVVENLLRIVQPTNLYLGQKDYQQCMVIAKLVELMSWNEKLTIHICSTLRETDGLAMSSRNVRLADIERKQASAIYKSLLATKSKFIENEFSKLIETQKLFLLNNGFDSIDYLTIANANTLEPLNEWDGKQKIVLLIAAFIGGVRLIDNMLLN